MRRGRAQVFAGALVAASLFSPGDAKARRPQLSAEQARSYSYEAVVVFASPATSGAVESWDPRANPIATEPAAPPDFVVDGSGPANGTTTFRTIHEAVAAALACCREGARKPRLHILVKPGVYRELLYVPPSPVAITIQGGAADASHTRISARLDAATTGDAYRATFGRQFVSANADVAAMFVSVARRASVGTAGSAVAWIRADGFRASNLTIENAFDGNLVAGREADGEARYSQAVALLVDDADRVHFENVRVLGRQDTLYLKATQPARAARSYFANSYIEGDVDFIFGEATGYFHRTEIRSLGSRPYSYAMAPSTHYLSRHGFVFSECRFTHDGSPNALAGKFKLARQWFRGSRCTPYGLAGRARGRCRLGESDTGDETGGTISRSALEAVGKIAILDSRIGAHIDKVKPWSDWNAPGTARYRPVQYDSGDYWAMLLAAGIDPVGQLGHSCARSPVEPFLAEYRNFDE